jgi:signal transduction histidine kinase
VATRLAIPATVLVVLCALALGVALAGPVGSVSWLSSGTPQQQALAEAAALAGAATLVAILTIVLVAAYARRLSHEISDLTHAALSLASEELPRVIGSLREGEPSASEPAAQAARSALEAEWLGARAQLTKTAEIAAAVAAISEIERTAFEAATAEAGLRNGLRQILISLGRRNQSLLHRQLKIIDHLEQQAASPGELEDLFALDHLTTRMRRHAESLTIMSGASPIRSWSSPVPVIDVIRAAVAEVEDYKRVTVATDAEESVAAPAVTDLIHLLAELIENATLFSPSATRVEVRAERVANGFVIEVEDRGLGIEPEQLREINEQLASPPDFDLADADRLGLFVAGRLAARHGVQVELIPSAYRGTRAVVVLPDGLITTSAEAIADEDDSVLRGVARLNLQLPAALSLAGATGPSDMVPWDAVPPNTVLPDTVLPDTEPDVLPTRERVPRQTGLPRRDRSVQPNPGQPSPAQYSPAQSSPALPSSPADSPLDSPDPGEQPGGPHRRLPRRVRPGSPEQLATGTPVRMPGAARPAEAPAPEHARNLAASLQSSWLRSREADDEMPDTDLGAPAEAPDSEEMLWLTATDRAGPSLATSPGSLMTWPPGLMISAGRCCCLGMACSSPPQRISPARTPSTCPRWRRRFSPWRRAPGSGSTRAASGRRSSSSKKGCSSSRRPARAVASRRSARRTRTRAWSPMRWRCWSSAPGRTLPSRPGSRPPRLRLGDRGAAREELETSRFRPGRPSLRGDGRPDRASRRPGP